MAEMYLGHSPVWLGRLNMDSGRTNVLTDTPQMYPAKPIHLLVGFPPVGNLISSRDFGAQGDPDFAGAAGDIALPAAAFERGLDRGQAQVGALLGGGARPSTPGASPWARSSKATRAAG